MIDGSNIEKIEIYPKYNKLIIKYNNEDRTICNANHISFSNNMPYDKYKRKSFDIHLDIESIVTNPPENKLLRCNITTYYGDQYKKICVFINNTWYYIESDKDREVRYILPNYYNVESWEVIE